MISILVPFRSDNGQRAAVWEWCRKRWEQQVPEAEIVVGVDDTPGVFSLAIANNNAASKAKGDTLLCMGADFIAQRSWYEAALLRFEVGRDIAVAPNGQVWRLDAGISKRILRQPVAAPLPTPKEYRVVTAFGGLWFLRKDTYWQLGGYDESMRGWGGEDTDFLHRLRAAGNVHRQHSVVLHLWHERKKWEKR